MKIALTMRAGKDDAIVEMVLWHKNIGDRVKKGELVGIAKISKAEVDLEASVDGIFIERCAEVDGEPIPRPDEANGDWDAVCGWIETATENHVVMPDEKNILALVTPASPERKDLATQSVGIAAVAMKVLCPKFTRAYPLVRQEAKKRNLDINMITGSGPEGIVLLKDLIDVAVSSTANQKNDYVIRPLGVVRKTIAKNMELSWRCIPHAATSVRVNFRTLIEARTRAKNIGHYAEIKNHARFDVVTIDAIIDALCDSFAELNSCYGCEHLGFEGIKHFSHINLGVAYNHSSGLLVPVLHNIETANFGTIAERMDELARTMHAGSLKPDMFKDATFTFNNVGAFKKSEDSSEFIGSDDGISIIPHGQSVICSLHRIVTEEKSPWYGYASLGVSFDHRAHDGAVIIRFLNVVKEHIEQSDFNKILSY